MLKINTEHNIYKNEYNWVCYDHEYESKFKDIPIVIDNKLSHKSEVYNILSQYPGYKSIYTDGSKNYSNTAMAFYIPHIKCGRGRKLPSQYSIFSAECYAIYSAMKFIACEQHHNWIIITDSMSALKALKMPNYLLILIT